MCAGHVDDLDIVTEEPTTSSLTVWWVDTAHNMWATASAVASGQVKLAPIAATAGPDNASNPDMRQFAGLTVPMDVSSLARIMIRPCAQPALHGGEANTAQLAAAMPADTKYLDRLSSSSSCVSIAYWAGTLMVLCNKVCVPNRPAQTQTTILHRHLFRSAPAVV